MGKPTGFMEYQRELPVDRSPRERIKDWQEFHEHFAVGKLEDQASRCMDCGIPFCHTGTLISGMASGLPDQQPDPGMERSGLPRPVAGSPGTPSQDQQFPGVYGPRVPGAVRGLLRVWALPTRR